MIYMVFLAAMFSSTYIFNGITVGDVIAAFIIFWGFFRFKLQYKSPKNHVILFLLVMWSLVNGVLVYSFGLLNVGEYINSFIKIVFYTIAYISMYTLLRQYDINTLSKKLSIVLSINSIIAIYIYIAMYLNLPFEFFWYGMDTPITSAYYGGFGFVRARGIFPEPASLGYFLVMGFAFLLLNGYKMKKRTIAIISSAIILTFSIVTYFLAGLVIIVYFRSDLQRIIKIFVIAVVALSILCTIPVIRESLQVGIVDRISNVINGGVDNSGALRLNDTWDIAFTNLMESNFLGVGLGNHDVSYARAHSINPDIANFETQNVLSYILGTLGPIGLVLFLSLFKVFRHNKFLGLVFFASLFTNGNFLSIIFWVFYSIYSTASINARESKIDNIIQEDEGYTMICEVGGKLPSES